MQRGVEQLQRFREHGQEVSQSKSGFLHQMKVQNFKVTFHSFCETTTTWTYFFAK